MSTEVVAKKRGRPKKVISEPIEVESIKITPARAKTTKTAAKPVPAKTGASTPATATKPVLASKIASKPVPKTSSPKVVAATSSSSEAPHLRGAETIINSPSTFSKPVAKAEVKKETIQKSRILSQVQEKYGLPTANLMAAQPSSKPATSSSQNLQPPAPLSTPPVAARIEAIKKPVHKPPNSATPTVAAQLSNAVSSTPKPVNTPPKAPPPPPTAATAPKLPIAALNSAVVNNISTRAGAKPSLGGSKPLPANYKSSARKVTMLIVALPILIFSSYGLYERSDEVKLLFNPGLKRADKEVDSSSSSSSTN